MEVKGIEHSAPEWEIAAENRLHPRIDRKHAKRVYAVFFIDARY
jgi:hypothetical protein